MARSYKALPPCGKSSRACWLTGASLFTVSLVSCGLLLGGCDLHDDDLETASTRPFTTSGVDPVPGTLAATDIAAIGSALARTPPAAGSETKWDNPVTGSAGRISEVVALSPIGGRACWSFDTTVNGLGGLTALTGVGCRESDGHFVIEGLAPKV